MVLFDCAPSCQSKLHHQGGNIQYCRLQAQATKDKDNIERGVTGTESPKAGHTWGLIPGGILHKILPASFLYFQSFLHIFMQTYFGTSLFLNSS